MHNKMISVIIPTYNTARYLSETIQCVLAQSIGRQNIELIIIDDGSTDDTASVCKNFSDTYPETITYVYQRNQGVSAARNKGLSVAHGKYINFLDADDKWSRNALRALVAFMENERDTVDFVAAKIKFFDGDINEHPSNYKFRSTRIINTKDSPDNPIFHLPTCVFRRDALYGLSFDTNLSISEDVKFISQVLIRKKAYGVVAGPTYHYRKHMDDTSAISGQAKNRDYYLKVPDQVYQYMLDNWKNDEFVQYMVLSDLQWRLRQSKQMILTQQEQELYKNTVYAIIKQLEPHVIITKRSFPLDLKLFMLRYKYGPEYEKHVAIVDGEYYIDGYKIPTQKDNMIVLDFIRPQKDGAYVIEGYRLQPEICDDDIFIATTVKQEYSLIPFERRERTESFFNDEIYNGGGFSLTIYPGKIDKLSFMHRKKDGTLTALKIATNRFTRIGNLYGAYRIDERCMIRRSGKSLAIRPIRLWRKMLYEALYIVRILGDWKLAIAYEKNKQIKRRNFAFLPIKKRVFERYKAVLLSVEAIGMIPPTLLLRALYRLHKLLVRREVWVVSDRGMAAGDNGEVLFEYITHHSAAENSKVFFAISKNSKDFMRLNNIGRTVNYGSLHHKLLVLRASKLISSHADIDVLNPFYRQLDHFVDMLDFEFIFLQHGVIYNDLSRWLNRFNMNISKFIVSAPIESRSIMRYPYYYSDDDIITSGMPRYDKLNSKESNNKLIIAPTHRVSLALQKTDKYGERQYDPDFSKSKYFAFYNRLINDKKILAAMRSVGMKGEFYIHPNFAAQASDFDDNEVIKSMEFPHNYNNAINDGTLLVTDYSSIAFDFAYLKKPIVYTQFDWDTFYSKQLYDKADFFDVERDGFGTVTHSYDDAVREVCDLIKHGSQMSDLYKNRVEKFFYHHDQKNSERVYNAIAHQNSDSGV